jgi:hypothetical protein
MCGTPCVGVDNDSLAVLPSTEPSRLRREALENVPMGVRITRPSIKMKNGKVRLPWPTALHLWRNPVKPAQPVPA